jgi:hypothetical protein
MKQQNLYPIILTLALIFSLSACDKKSSTTKSKNIIITVDASKKISSAGVIADLLGQQIEPEHVNIDNPDKWGVAAFREIGFNIGDISLFGRIQVSRGSDGKLNLDFSKFDSHINFMRDTLGCKSIDFTVQTMPRVLAPASVAKTPRYMSYAPENYAEWRDIVTRSVKHIRNDLKMPGASYATWGEPESWYGWFGHYDKHWKLGDEGVIDDYIEMYVETWQAVKAGDPEARVGGPTTMTVRTLKELGVPWAVEEFLAKLQKYNRNHPDSAVTLDELHYQGYNWDLRDTLDVEINLAVDLLKKYGFPENTPLVLLGWNLDWTRKPTGNSPQKRASFLAGNLMRELAPAYRQRKLARAYIWPFDGDMGSPNQMSLVYLPAPEHKFDGASGTDDPYVDPEIKEYKKMPAHAALVILSRMQDDDDIISARADTSCVWSLATVSNKGLKLMMTNYSKDTIDVVPRLINYELAGKKVTMVVQRVDEKHSSDGKGLEEGETISIRISPNGELPLFRLSPYAIIGINLKK